MIAANLANSFRGFPFALSHASVEHRKDDAKEAQGDEIERSVPGTAGPDHQHELVLLADKIDWHWIDGESAPLYRAAG
ncbi:hypothetical protein J2R78_001471 [Bradyrhizobium sp. USDA 4538]|nr:hypothetical protein [Bradyrhizobium sp. USDA 4538]MCP1899068.1 hypothetical protein [Bradyrhizobium sp. USDA 4537]MCP1986819.1 hypothetical protein [Bradyrhizobium sp. USDA 4539]